MKKLLLGLGAGLLLCACEAPFELYDLRCEGLSEPLAIDSAQPHFSWKIRTRKPMEQAGYELQVGDFLGKEESAEQVMVPYKGPALSKGQLYRWRVRVFDKAGKASRWSPWQRFGLAPETLKGAYIGALPGEGRSPLLRRRFKLEKTGAQAILYVNSLGYHEAWLNGVKLSDAVLQPAVSQLDKRSLLVAYDAQPHLKKGENELLLSAGSGWYKKTTFGAAYEGPLVKAQLDVDAVPVVWTDAEWEGADSGYRDTGSWLPHGFGGERLDARVQPQWGPVDVVPVEGLPVSAQMCEPTRVQEVLEAVHITDEGDSCYLVDMGKVACGMVDILFPALEEGTEVTIDYSDDLKGDFGSGDFGQDTYIAAGKGEERFSNRFNHHVFRYASIYPLPAPPQAVKLHRIRTDYAKGGSFCSSDPRLNKIYNMLDWTLDNLNFGGYMVDCASIERLGYGGDGNASTLTLQAMADVGPMYMNWLTAWMDAQRPDGSLPHTAPNPYTAGGGPYWCSFLVQAPWRTWMAYGDARGVERCYPAMRKWLEYVDAHTVDGLLKAWPNTDYRGWYLGDWAAPKGVDVQHPLSVDLVNNCVLCQCYLQLEQMARLLGREEDAKGYRLRYETLSRRIQETFYEAETAVYATGSQIDMVYPLLVGVTPPELRGQVVRSLKQRTEAVYKGHLATGLVGIAVLAEWAAREGECDWLYKLLMQEGYPGYLYMLENGATGTWEHWDGERSRLHNCFNGIGSWFYQALGGIVPLEPGYRKVRVKPQVPQGLEWVEVTQNTPYGPIRVKRHGADVTVEVPPGVTLVD